MPETFSFGVEPITCHAWNKDRTQIVLSLNSNEAEVHQFSGGKWTLKETLGEHTKRVTGLDWGVKTNQIVTCGADCNAYVWTQQSDGKWKPALVVLRINRAATCVKWSPMENKFAVGSGSRLVAVCYYDKENDWWISKQIKKPIRSTITCIDWHPDNMLIACGSTDFKARVFSAYIKEVDGEKPPPSNWGSKLVFANPLQEFASIAGGWVHDIRFSPSGDKLVWVAHDSTICVVDSKLDLKLVSVKTQFLPFLNVLWLTEGSIVVSGFDCSPMLFNISDQAITFASKCDDSDGKQQQGKKFSAMDHFKTADSKGTTVEMAETSLSSIHQNSITWVARHTGGGDKCVKFSTSGSDGQLILWDKK